MSLRLWQIVPDLATVDALAEPWQKLYAHSTIVATLAERRSGGAARAAVAASTRQRLDDSGALVCAGPLGERPRLPLKR